MTISQAILGGTIDVLTLDGIVTLKIPRGSQHESRLVLTNRGIKGQNRKRGDQIVRLKLQIPQRTTPYQKKIMSDFSKIALEEKTKKKPDGIFSKIVGNLKNTFQGSKDKTKDKSA